MINIEHQKVTSKPPISQKFTKSPRNAGARERNGGKKIKEEIKDCNQNIIETDSCSLDQLCSMISDLEQSLVHEVVAVETGTLPAENPAAFIDLDHVSNYKKIFLNLLPTLLMTLSQNKIFISINSFKIIFINFYNYYLVSLHRS